MAVKSGFFLRYWGSLFFSAIFLSGSSAFNCPNNLHAFPPDSCVSLSPGKRAECDSVTDGLAVLSESQLTSGGILSSYGAAVLEGNQLMWLGYRYNNGSQLLEDGQGLSQTVSGSVLNDENNFDLSSSESIGESVCVAVNRNGSFVRRQCSETLQWSLCEKEFTAPNATVSGPASVTEGSPVTLNCAVTGTDATVSWLAAIGTNPPSSLSSSSSSYTIDSYSQSTHSGWYFCVASNALGAYVSTPVRLDTTASSNTVSAVSVVPSVSMETYGSAVNYSCTDQVPAGNVARVFWFVNGVASASPAQLVVASVQQAGFYQCWVMLNNGDVMVGERRVVPTAGVPGVVDDVSVEPLSTSSLSVQWLCPEAVGTHDPILLNYQVTYYSSASSSALQSINAKTLDAMQDKNSCLLQASMMGLDKGTSYSVKVRAVLGDVLGEEPVITAQEATFGLAPGAVSNFVVFRATDQKTVQAKWDKVETTPPVGVVSEYHIEYRQYTKKSVSSIKNSADQTTVTISNVINSDSYELRVRAGVQASADPLQFSYGPFTEWKRVGDGVPITAEPLSTARDLTGVIAASVVVGGLTFIIILSLFIVGVACVVLKARRGELASFYKGDHTHLQELEEVEEDG